MRTINTWCTEVTDWRISKGFSTPDEINEDEVQGTSGDAVLALLMALITEIAAAAEFVRDNNERDFRLKLFNVIYLIRDLQRVKINVDPVTLTNKHMMLGKLMLVVTEVAEAAEAVVNEDTENFVEELADTLIRIFDIAGTVGLDLGGAVAKKMEINKKRPYRHGRKTTL